MGEVLQENMDKEGGSLGQALLWNGEVEARALEGEQGGGGQFGVTLIRPGRSHNGVLYSAAVLAAAAAKFEGAAAFADHPSLLDQSRAGGRSLRDLVGVFHSVECDADGALRACLRLLPGAAWAGELMRGYIADRAAGQVVPAIGLSADLLVRRRPAPRGSGARYEVTAVEAVNSVDLVYRPAAGGSFDRILNNEERFLNEERNVESATVAEASQPPVAPDVAMEAEAAPVEAADPSALEAALAAAALPEAARQHLRRQLAGRQLAPAELEAEIEGVRRLLAATAPVRGAGQRRLEVSGGNDSLDRFTAALEMLFELEVPESRRNVPRLSGIREAYLTLTGDYDFSGRVRPERALLREAGETTQLQMDSVVAGVLNKRLLRDYDAQPKWWRPLVSVVNLRDMRQQTRVLLNDFGALAPVAENQAYNNVAWGDTEETYNVGKRGNLVYVSMESIINDDLRAFTRLPRKLAAAAAVTINEFVAALWTANAGAGPVLKDGLNVFASARGNSVAVALDAATLASAITEMSKFTNSAGKRIGLRPRYLLVPPELEWQAYSLTRSTLLPGSVNNDINHLQGVVQPVVVPNWLDANNWYLHAEPATVEGIELGFLDGRQAPEILVQDDPRSGYPFSHDALVWKVRWIFGGGWLDWRAGYASIPA